MNYSFSLLLHNFFSDLMMYTIYLGESVDGTAEGLPEYPIGMLGKCYTISSKDTL